ncbi:DMT family transporter [Dictyobacter formicarum]|uniref:Multidrug resistance efflux transporter family protein n=1 Tax=Dictyobacter formicarum TaxID=2778368 RepID=A0ABQ3VDH1_9CHLR|nr:multidrug resistance efflux transporter family protein [Dictyobacter formicarum]GHO83799.1 hypothetical protein KSZ_18050 [Dictyobacter formicarum]
MKPILLGIAASCFFACSFILNHAMQLEGGSWIWTSALRFLFMLPFLLLLVGSRKNLMPLLRELKTHFWRWFLWSLIGFGLFYVPICFAAAFEPGWLVAGTWQITIIAGTLLVPFFHETVATPYGPKKVRKRLPRRGLLLSLLIVLGVGVMQFEHATHIAGRDIFFGVVPIVVAAFAYPLGNRKMMKVCEGKFDTYQRVLGMTICSLPLWLGLSIYGWFTVGPPSAGQSLQALIVAISSGVIATILFFSATDMVKGSLHHLAAVEATQAGEVLFTLIGEVLFFSAALPTLISLGGMLLVLTGMILHSLASSKNELVVVAQTTTEL